MRPELAVKSISIAIDGMSCASCVARVEARIKTIPGVTDASVNLATETADVTYTESMVSPTDVATTLTESGYPSTPRTPTSSNDESLRVDHSSDLKRLTILATVLAIPVFAMEMGSHLFPFVNDFIATTIGTRTNQLIQFFLTTAVLFGPGLVFFTIGIPRLLRGHPDMNSLVALGTAAAYGYSVVSLFFTNLLPEGAANVYFESAVVIVVLILLGRYLEARAKGRTGQAIKKLITLQPNTATVIRDDAAVVVDVESIIPGDMLQIKIQQLSQVRLTKTVLLRSKLPASAKTPCWHKLFPWLNPHRVRNCLFKLRLIVLAACLCRSCC